MFRHVIPTAIVGLTLLTAVPATPSFACNGNGNCDHNKPAPAPLLAAGIPAFLALGGGVLFTKLRRRGKRD